MNTKLSLLIISALVATVFIAGCSGNGGSAPSPAATVTTPATIAPLYSAGDVVKNPKLSSSFALLILGYDKPSDKYQRALIYANGDGSWGYRMNANTDMISRAVVERDYTDLVTTLTPSSVPIGAPARVTTQATPDAGSVTTVKTPSVTTTTALRPTIKKIIPDSGYAGTSVAITDLTGENFKTGTTVKLVKTGKPDIIATNVKVNAPTELTCTFAIPSDATAGSRDLVVTSPEGLAATLTDIFLVHTSGPSVTGTTASSGLTISSIDPSTVVTGGGRSSQRIRIMGSNIPLNPTVILQRAGSSNIIGTSVYMPTESTIEVSFDIPAASNGLWDVEITSSDYTTVLGKSTNGLTIN